MTAYDFIIIGGGSAGCIVAANLAKKLPQKTILLLEAGPPVGLENEMVWDPRQWVLVSAQTELSWGYQSVPQSQLNRRILPMRRAKGLGGCSIHNAMVYVRGGKKGFDRWADAGNPGWDYHSVLPCFGQIERQMTIATQPNPRDPFINDLIAACDHHDLPFVADYNHTPDRPCVSPLQFAIKAGKRQTTASVFIANPPPNLTIETRQLVEKIIIDKSSKSAKAVIVSALADGTQKEISANAEIILSAGAIGSPQILLLSGIGPEQALANVSISPIHRLPGVGQNFQDDLYLTSWFNSRQALPQQPCGLMGAVIFAHSPGSSDDRGSGDQRTDDQGTDIQCALAAATMPGLDLAAGQPQSWLIYPNIQRLKSRGSVTLASANAAQPPIIDPNYLAARGDLEKCVAAIKLALSLAQDKALSRWYNGTRLPSVSDDEALAHYVRQTADSCYHYAGTCKMGPCSDPMAVVNADLQVHGIKRLRVIDASIIPQTVSGNTAAATMMIAQKGSCLVSWSGLEC